MRTIAPGRKCEPCFLFRRVDGKIVDKKSVAVRFSAHLTSLGHFSLTAGDIGSEQCRSNR
jgi:hypothetical protein